MIIYVPLQLLKANLQFGKNKLVTSRPVSEQGHIELIWAPTWPISNMALDGPDCSD